jgi:hypothetical protein
MGYHIDPKFYNQLIKDQKKLRALEQAGVDNWEGYSDAMEILQKDKEDENDT